MDPAKEYEQIDHWIVVTIEPEGVNNVIDVASEEAAIKKIAALNKKGIPANYSNQFAMVEF